MENIVLILNMFIHLVAVIAYVGGLFYSLILVAKRKRLAPVYLLHLDNYLERFFLREPLLWMGYLGIIILTGFNFGLISLSFHGKPPELAPLAFGALTAMIILALISAGLVNLLWWKLRHPVRGILTTGYPSAEQIALLADLRHHREIAIQRLLILAFIAMFCAVTLRFMA